MPDLKPIADSIYGEVIGLAEEFSKAKGLAGIGSIIAAVIRKVEAWKTSTGTLTGPDKKKVAVDVLNRMVNLPVIPEWIEEKVLSVVIDWFVDFFNRVYGQAWTKVVSGLPF